MKREQVDIALEELQRAYRGSRTLPHPDTWYSVLAHCDAYLAVIAIARLIDTRKTAPTIADFREEYALAEKSRVPDPKPDKRCETCDGTGWAPGPDIPYQPSRAMVEAANDAREVARAEARSRALAEGREWDPKSFWWEPPVYVRSSVVPCLCAAGKKHL